MSIFNPDYCISFRTKSIGFTGVSIVYQPIPMPEAIAFLLNLKLAIGSYYVLDFSQNIGNRVDYFHNSIDFFDLERSACFCYISTIEIAFSDIKTSRAY